VASDMSSRTTATVLMTASPSTQTWARPALVNEGSMVVLGVGWVGVKIDAGLDRKARSLRGRRSIGCNARETGLTRYHLLRPGANPGLLGTTA